MTVCVCMCVCVCVCVERERETIAAAVALSSNCFPPLDFQLQEEYVSWFNCSVTLTSSPRLLYPFLPITSSVGGQMHIVKSPRATEPLRLKMKFVTPPRATKPLRLNLK